MRELRSFVVVFGFKISTKLIPTSSLVWTQSRVYAFLIVYWNLLAVWGRRQHCCQGEEAV